MIGKELQTTISAIHAKGLSFRIVARFERGDPDHVFAAEVFAPAGVSGHARGPLIDATLEAAFTDYKRAARKGAK